ncbi:hypothetical protein BEL07_25585 [Mycolicibacterium grossiae]|uniref:Uncharacterized protein n=1 Tax=Mycolicibacterium grossiae TaxID=1552759 RepID=A0A1E8PXT0_9MYCO|nr:hypothetical protein BEL07_25585 [Mycolicibacterium grossiae]
MISYRGDRQESYLTMIPVAGVHHAGSEGGVEGVGKFVEYMVVGVGSLVDGQCPRLANISLSGVGVVEDQHLCVVKVRVEVEDRAVCGYGDRFAAAVANHVRRGPGSVGSDQQHHWDALSVGLVEHLAGELFGGAGVHDSFAAGSAAPFRDQQSDERFSGAGGELQGDIFAVDVFVGVVPELVSLV